MTQLTHIQFDLDGRRFKDIDDIPDEMLDYLPENMEDDDDYSSSEY